MDTFKGKWRRAIFPVAAALLVLLWWGNHMPRTEEYVFASKRVPQGWDGARIVHLSDLHGKEFGKDNQRLLQAVADAQPELIVITGDIADAQSGLDTIPAVLEGLAAIAPTYYVTGNHEWGAGFVGELREMLSDAGVHLNEIDKVVLVGGATKMPMIRHFVAKLFRRLPDASVNPDEAVALGAAIQGAMKEREQSSVK